MIVGLVLDNNSFNLDNKSFNLDNNSFILNNNIICTVKPSNSYFKMMIMVRMKVMRMMTMKGDDDEYSIIGHIH